MQDSDNKVIQFDRALRLEKKNAGIVEATTTVKEAVVEEEKEPIFLEYQCPECQSEHFTMLGMEESDVIMLYCADCSIPIDGSFIWTDVGIDTDE